MVQAPVVTTLAMNTALSDEELKESQTSLLYSLAIIFVSISTVSVALRIFTRARLLSTFGPDDFTITIAQLLAIAVSITTVLEAVWGLGRHTPVVPHDDAARQSRSLYANTLLYNAGQTLTKISFLIQYRRLFPTKRIQKVCFCLLLFIGLWGIAQEFIVSFACTPLTSFVPKMSEMCIDSMPVWYLTSSMNIVTDLMIFFVPIQPVMRLQMHTRKKILLLGLFCLGFFTCVLSLVRLSTLHQGINTDDPFWDNAPAAWWSVIELNCGILCACLPTLRPLAQKLFPHLHSTRGTNAASRTYSSNRLSALHMNHLVKHKESGIYVRRDVEMHSSTDLTAAAAGARPSEEGGCSQKTTVTGDSRYDVSAV